MSPDLLYRQEEGKVKDVLPPDFLRKRYIAMFIDGHNLCRWPPTEGGKVKRFRVEEIDWKKLFELMLDSIDGGDYLYVGRTEVHHAPFDGRARTARLIKAGLRRSLADYREIVLSAACTEGNAAATIVNRMWACAKILDDVQTAARLRFPHKMTFLLAGGNAAYGDAVRDIREIHGNRIDLRLHTFSWTQSLSTSLTTVSEKIIPLDDDPPIRRRPTVLT